MTAQRWTQRPLVGFDLETTGVDVETARIVTGSVVRWGGGKPTVVRNWTSDLDGMAIPASATEIHGITTEHVRTVGRPAHEVVEDMTGTLAMFAALGWPVVAMNAQFDLTILERECVRYGVPSLWLSTPCVLDPRVLDKEVDRYRKGRRRLVDLCGHYAVKMEGGAHNSEVDAKAACAVVWKIVRRYPRLAREELRDLHALQARWAVEQNHSFREHQLSKYGEADDSPFGWPLVPEPLKAGT